MQQTIKRSTNHFTHEKKSTQFSLLVIFLLLLSFVPPVVAYLVGKSVRVAAS